MNNRRIAVELLKVAKLVLSQDADHYNISVSRTTYDKKGQVKDSTTEKAPSKKGTKALTDVLEMVNRSWDTMGLTDSGRQLILTTVDKSGGEKTDFSVSVTKKQSYPFRNEELKEIESALRVKNARI